MVDFYNPNRYRGRRVANKVGNFFWTVVGIVVVIVVGRIVVKACLPWLHTLWQTVS